MAKNYELLEHTADMGLRVKAKDLPGLFREAGLAMFRVASKKLPGKGKELHKISLAQKASDVEELFINWLNELLSLSSAEGMIFEDIKIDSIDEHHIEAVALGSEMVNYKVDKEIKAATYHELKLQKEDGGWIAEVIFDV